MSPATSGQAAALPADAMASALRVLGAALDHRDQATSAHCDRVSRLARQLGTHCDLDPGELFELELAARFHDVGKIGIPDSILLRPARLDADARLVMQTHAERGEQLFLATGREDAARVARLIRHHHEAVDGSGYPDALRGGDIPLACRVLTLVDAYDAMTSQRPYRAPMPHRTAMHLLGEAIDRALDPEVFAVFERLGANGRPLPD